MKELFIFLWIALATIYSLKPKSRTEAWVGATAVAITVYSVALIFFHVFSNNRNFLWLWVCGIILGFTLLYYLELKADGKLGFPWFIIGSLVLILLIGIAQRHFNTKMLESIGSKSSIEKL